MPRFRSFLLLTSVFFAISVYTNAASVPADQIFPPATQAFVSIRNFDVFAEHWKQTQFGQLLSDPLMQDFKKEVQTQLNKRMENMFGLSLEGITSLPSGEVAFGLIAPPDQTPGYVLFMDITGKRSKTEKYLEDLTKKLVSNGVKTGSETYKGQQVAILTFPPPETPHALNTAKPETTTEPAERHIYYTLLDEQFLASDQLPLLQLLADRIPEPAAQSLSYLESYQVIMKRCIGDMPEGILPSLSWYVDPLGVGESVRKLLPGSAAAKRKNKPTIASILKQQGFDALQGVGGTVNVKEESQETVYRTFIFTKKPYRLAMQMLDFPDSVNFAPPIWMPADLARCTMFYIDPAAIFDNFGVLFDALVMPGEEGVWKDIIAGLEEDPHGPKINIRNELIAHLGNRVLGMSRYEKPITVQSESIVVAVELKTDHEQAMRDGILKLFGNDPEMQGTEHRSYMIWHRIPPKDMLFPIEIEIEGPISLVDPTLPKTVQTEEETEPPVFPNGGVTVAKGCLFVSTDIEYLKSVLDRLETAEETSKSPITDEPEYQEIDRIFAGLGLTDRPHFFQFFARTHETLRPTYEMIRQNQMAQSQALLAKVLNDVLSSGNESGVRQQIIEGETMPEFEKVQHYFGTVGIFGITEKDGYFIKGFAVERETN